MGNKMDPRVDSDRVGGHGNTTGAGGYGSTHTGTHSTGLGGASHGSDPTGPHDSRMANKMDPRVDSDRVGGHGNTAGAGGYGSTHTGAHSGLTGNTHSTGLGGASHGNDPTGPHSSHLGNQMDPRVDSDRIGGHGNTAGAGGYGHTTGAHTTGTHHSGVPQGTTRSDPSGPHDTRMANVLDPRVDSDRPGGHGNTTGAGGYGHTTGTHTGAHTGTHTGAGNFGAGNHLPGPAPNTAGAHKSDMLNKADPRIDSDLDGSKTVGGNRTMG